LINKYIDDVPVEKVREFEANLYKYLDVNTDASKAILEKKELDADVEEKIKTALSNYKETLDYLVK